MILSTELFSLLSPQGLPMEAPNDRRRTPRVSSIQGATIRGYDPGEDSIAMPVGIKDLSPAGVCILQYQPLAPGQQFIVALPTRDGGSMNILCTIRWCRAVNEALYAMGAAFTAVVEPLPHPEPLRKPAAA